MKSIQTKFIILIASALLTLAFFIGGFSVLSVNKIAKTDSQMMINAVCTEQAIRLDTQLEKIEQSVEFVYNYACDHLDSADSLFDLDYRKDYNEKIERLLLDVANHTDNVISAYYRINPVLYECTEGTFFIKHGGEGEFQKNELTDILSFPEDDFENVGWYYVPINEGKPVWLRPYFNPSIGVEMISYVIPIFKDGQTVGIIGMDMDFAVFVNLAEETAIFENGRTNLIDVSSRTVYYKMKNDPYKVVRSIKISDDTYENIISSKDSIEKTQRYELDGTKYELVFRTIRNGMKYVAYAPLSEINAKRNDLLTGIMIITMGSLIAFIFFTCYMTRQITRPLRLLTDASKKIAQGDWEIQIPCKTKDEVATLSNSIMTMADRLKKYVSEVNQLAYKDGLTGVKNKTCYNDYIKVISQDYGDNMRKYAVVLFDINNLKVINDNYGHDTGDILITASCGYICKTFAHSPVFRIGGDEFVAILEGSDFEKRNELLNEFERNMKDIRLSVEPFAPISIAFGMAEHTAQSSTYDDVFKQADKNMYNKKSRMKEKLL